MTRHRTTARGVSLLILTALLAAAVVASSGAAPKPGLIDGSPIVFPLIGDYAYGNNYGDARAQGRHAGIDIERVPWRTPVVAAEAGRIKWWTTSARAGCMLYLYGKSGTTYLYIHLNNDLTENSEDKGGCKLGVAYAVDDGAKVTAGEQIAYLGDSGDAEGHHHLHFEVHPNDGADVNPFPYLNAAERLLFPGRIGTSFSLGVRGIPVAAGAGTIELRATSVRWWPGGQWTPVVGERPVTLAVAKGAVVDTELVAALESPERRALQSRATGLVVTAYTARSKVTAEALRGAPGELVAARVTRPGGTTVATDPADAVDPVDDGPRSTTGRIRRPVVAATTTVVGPGSDVAAVARCYQAVSGFSRTPARYAGASALRRKSTIAPVGAPGVKTSATPRRLSSSASSAGIVPPTTTSTSPASFARSPSTIRGTSVMCAPERIEIPTASASSWIAVSTICSGVWWRPV